MQEIIEYSQKLQRVGFTPKQAEAQIDVLAKTIQQLENRIENHFASKSEFKSEIQRLDRKIEKVRDELMAKMDLLEYKIIIKLGVLMTVQLGALAAFIRFFQ